jgi:hypothetical protein
MPPSKWPFVYRHSGGKISLSGRYVTPLKSDSQTTFPTPKIGVIMVFEERKGGIMKRIALLLVFVLLVTNTSFAVEQGKSLGKISIGEKTLKDALKNLRMAKSSYEERRNSDIGTAVIFPVFAILNFNWAAEHRTTGQQDLSNLATAYGVLFILGTVYALFVDLPEMDRRIHSIDKSIAEIEIELF